MLHRGHCILFRTLRLLHFISLGRLRSFLGWIRVTAVTDNHMPGCNNHTRVTQLTA